MKFENNNPPVSLLSSKAYQSIKGDIVTCVLAPGSSIAQLELAETYHMGLTPIREALRQLAQEGFVQPVPRLGYIVSPITIKDVQEIYEMRIILETSSFRLAATRGTDKELQDLLEFADFTYTYKDLPSYSRFLENNKIFHQSVASIARNSRLVQQISRVMDELTRVFHLGLDIRDSASEMRNDHLALCRALIEHDASRAEQLVRSEILLSRERVMEAIKNFSGQVLISDTMLAISRQSDWNS
ncbi:MAG: GntR family transcriptional regulator [Chloroflexi bacterium]|jgi:DNA-binding GntR family transcriptional regulator|nr:GntR family transcriptional regulator [Chloroflexota bacterium]BCY19225.1 GntR family transcriptional regulator [Leptolinea sp. HRD-7]